MAIGIRAFYYWFLAKLSQPLRLKRSSLAKHKKPPKITDASEFNTMLRQELAQSAPKYSNAKFFVASDLHYYSPDLGFSGEEWNGLIARDRKLFAESQEIMQELIRAFNSSLMTDFVLITGDLTKDGERLSHEKMADMLRKVNKQVYVIPGNHDIHNPDAAAFPGKKSKTPSISKEEFAEIYQDFGFKQALSRDPHSLSYFIEVKKDLCMLALDSVWPQERPYRELIVDGKMEDKTWQWLEEQLIWARRRNKAVFAMQHHPFLEHWPGEINFMPEYLIENYEKLGEIYLTYGVRAVFVGHFHAQDVTMRIGKRRRVYQILTGSPISYPCPYRKAAFKDNRLVCKTKNIKKTSSFATEADFKAHALAKLKQAVRMATEKPLRFLMVKKEDRDKIISSGENAYAANYAGIDDAAAAKKQAEPYLPQPEELGRMGRFALKLMGYVIEGMWQDKEPFADNDFDLPLGR